MNRKRFLALIGASFLAALAPGASAAAAQEGAAAEPEKASEVPSLDEVPAADADASPRGAVHHFLHACRRGDHARAAVILDLDALSATERAEQGPVLARHLKVVLDRKFWVDLATLSADPGGKRDDGLPAELELLTTIESRGAGPIDVHLRRSAAGPDGALVWRFSAGTVARIPALYDEFGYGILGELLPRQFFELSFLEVQLWQWIGIMLIAIGAFFLSWLMVLAALTVLGPLVKRSRSNLDDRVLELVSKPLRFLVALVLFAGGLLFLRLAAPVERFLLGFQKGLVVLGFAWLFLRAVDVLAGLLKDRLAREGKSAAVAALPLGEKTIKVAVLGFAAIALMQNLGFNVTGVLAGLGVGGLALALAAQKTVENLFGGVSLILDQPIRVGDVCRFGDKVGTVEDVGLRSTKIRTPDRTVIAVPNAEFAALQLENLARRDQIRFQANLGLRYETTADQMRWVLAELRRLLLAHAKVTPDPARVRFVGYGAYSLDLEIFAYVSTTDFNEYLAVQEDLLLRIMDIVNESGTGFAFPSSTTYLARDHGNDPDRTKRAEEYVAGWRANGELPFPDFTPEAKAEIDDTIPYPEPSSAAAARD